MHMTVKIWITCLMTAGLIVSSVSHPSAMDGPDVVELATLSNIYEAVTFDHAMHVEMASCAASHHHTTGLPAENASCLPCHQASGEADEIACAGCHAVSPGNGDKMQESRTVNLYHTDTTGLKRAYHLQCLGCHKEMEAASGCEDCHPKRAVSHKVSLVNE